MIRKLLLVCFGAISIAATAQTDVNKEKLYAKQPLWIDMMEDEKSNFFEVEKAYKIYWEHHEEPEGEHDVIGEYQEREKIPSRRKQRKIEAESKIRMAMRKYNWWHEQTLPYVQGDGRILTAEERLKIWEANKKQNKQ
ncbi:MAG: hypothetical protein J0L80_13230 [Chitinophagales bacterium]|nr:hypothetical protein [Chitinophagales bacterium]